jgi:hypothetical protein
MVVFTTMTSSLPPVGLEDRRRTVRRVAGKLHTERERARPARSATFLLLVAKIQILDLLSREDGVA